MDIFHFILTPIRYLAFKPLEIFFIASILFAPCLARIFKPVARWIMLIVALTWVFFGIQEYFAQPSNNIRIDLALLAPIYMLMIFAWLICLLFGRHKK